MRIAALCPTFRRKELLSNCLALWLAQDYPAGWRRLFILDDEPCYDSQRGESWELHTRSTRHSSLGGKYNDLVRIAAYWEPDAYLVWEDDDIFLPGYVSAHAKCLEQHEFSCPRYCRSHYGGKIQDDPDKTFHGAVGFRSQLYQRTDGWPEYKKGQFDIDMVAQLNASCVSAGEPWQRCDQSQFIMGFSDTGSPHASGAIRYWGDTEWWEANNTRFEKIPYVGKLEAKYDARTKWVLQQCSLANTAPSK